MSKTLLDSEGLKLYDRLIKQYIANNAGGGSGGSGGSGDSIPRTGDRGELAGYEWFRISDIQNWDGSVTINKDAPDVSFGMVVVAENPSEPTFVMDENETQATLQSFTKVVFVSGATVSLGTNWLWQGGVAPSIGTGILIFHWLPNPSGIGVVFYVDLGLD